MVKSMLFAVALLLTLGCSSGGKESADAERLEGPPATLHGQVTIPPEIEALDIINVHMLSSGLLTGGQLTREQMTQLRQLGYRTMISLRPADEEGAGWEEEYAGAEGIDFHRLPIHGRGDVTRENAERLARLLEEAGEEPVAIYCASGNRVGGLLALKAHYLDGLSIEEAVAYGVRGGMTHLEPSVRSVMTVE